MRERFLACVRVASLDSPVRRGMELLGRLIGRKPWPFIVAPLLLILLLAYPFVAGMSRFQAARERGASSLQLFTPSGSLSEWNRERMEQYFPDGGYYSDRTLLSPNLLIILVSATDGGSVLRNALIQEYAELRVAVERDVSVPYNGSFLAYQDLCKMDRVKSHCQPDPLLLLVGARPVSELTYPFVNLTLSPEAGPQQRYIGPLFGGVATDSADRVVYAKYAKMIFNLPTLEPKLLKQYGKAWGTFVRNYASIPLELRLWSSEQYRKDMSLISGRTIRLLPILISFLFVCSVGSCCMADGVLSKPWLALAGVVSATCGIVVGYAILFIIGIDLIEIAMIVPFLVLSIGIDDMFVVLNVWRRSPSHLPVEERVSWTMRESGVSITVTTLTDAGVFLVGSCSVFPAVRIFCVYSSVSILFVFLFQITFFPAFLALSGKREKALRHCLTFRKVTSPNLYKCGCEECCSDARERERRRERSTPWPVLFFERKLRRMMSRAMTQAVVGASYLIYLALSTFCITNRLEQGLHISDLVPYKTDTSRYLKAYQDYFTRYTTAAEVVIYEPLEYSDRVTQQQLLSLVKALETTPFSLSIEFWLKDYLALIPSSSVITERESFYRSLVDGFLRIDSYARYSADMNLYLTADGRYVINSTRFYVPLQNMGLHNRSLAMKTLFEKVDAFRALGFPLLLHDVSFPLAEQFSAIGPGMILNVVIAVVGILLVSVLFIPCFRNCLVVSASVLSINFGVLAFLAAWGVRLDIISSITILLSIGFSVDFTSHVSYHFHHAPGKGGAEKLGTAMGTIGWPIVQSSLSTLVGVVTVIGVGAYIADTFIKTVVLVMLIGMYHGLLVLPVLLTLLTDYPFARSRDSSGGRVVEGRERDVEVVSQTSKTNETASTTVVETSPAPSQPKRGTKYYRSFIHGKQQTVRVDTAWIDSWLHGDIACAQQKGKYCAYCDTREIIAADAVRIKTLSHRSDAISTLNR